MFKPFRATFYNPKKFKKLDKVACPPYDVITDKYLQKLRANSKYNFSWVDLADNGDYKRAGNVLRSWIKDGIMVDDDKANFYLSGQKFTVEGKTFWRFGILGALKMDKPGVIRPHEHTHSKAKEDRAKMMRETRANLSPVFVIAPKKITFINSLYKRYLKKKPLFSFKDADNTLTYIWKISDEKDISKVSASFEKMKLIIADGHHRFEVASDFSREYQGGIKDCEYVLAYMVDEQPGLVILPINRVVDINMTGKELISKLEEKFDVTVSNEKKIKEEFNKYKGFIFGICLEGKFYLARLKNPKILDTIIKDKVFRKLDTYVLANLVYPLLGIEKPSAYANNMAQAKEAAVKGKAVFVMRPADMNNICDIVDNGFRMPQKSTYFHPKIGSGLVIRRFEP